MSIDERIRELRDRAKRLRESAQYADSGAAYREDMRAAQQADAEAGELVQQLHAEPPPY